MLALTRITASRIFYSISKNATNIRKASVLTSLVYIFFIRERCEHLFHFFKNLECSFTFSNKNSADGRPMNLENKDISISYNGQR